MLQGHLGTEVQRADGLSQEVARLHASALTLPRDGMRASAGADSARHGPAHALPARLQRSSAPGPVSPLTPTVAAAGFV